MLFRSAVTRARAVDCVTTPERSTADAHALESRTRASRVRVTARWWMAGGRAGASGHPVIRARVSRDECAPAPIRSLSSEVRNVTGLPKRLNRVAVSKNVLNITINGDELRVTWLQMRLVMHTRVRMEPLVLMVVETSLFAHVPTTTRELLAVAFHFCRCK